jgi:hypothetical protein
MYDQSFIHCSEKKNVEFVNKLLENIIQINGTTFGTSLIQGVLSNTARMRNLWLENGYDTSCIPGPIQYRLII